MMVFYVPGHRWVQDGAVLVDGVYRGEFSAHKTIADFPGAEIISLDDAAQRIEAVCCTEPVEINEDHFCYLRDVLPPLQWRGAGTPAESFKMSEFTNGRVTCIAVRIGGRYFSFEGVASTPHDLCVARVRDAFGLS